ncbi:hypothetical protein NS359_09000 [Curtobacterium oceanosedimentum]|uniref:Uncharacterized protein n=2 Tax=Curtobacterium oceanosedimentum TaxID=465820 RepID=A0A147DQE3_9MICO|nr:hypothetical protein NS359_09000 [Curtobacterium oceanosedimentum]
MRVVSVAIVVEGSWWEGDPEGGAAGYTEDWDVLEPGRGAAAHWGAMAGAARMAAVDEGAVRGVEDAARGLPAAAVGAEPAHTSLPAADGRPVAGRHRASRPSRGRSRIVTHRRGPVR